MDTPQTPPNERIRAFALGIFLLLIPLAQFLWNAWAVHLFFLAACGLFLWEILSEFRSSKNLSVPNDSAAFWIFLFCAAVASLLSPYSEPARTFLCGLFVGAVLFLSARKTGPSATRVLLQTLAVSGGIFDLIFVFSHLSSPTVDAVAGIAFYVNHNVASSWILFGLAASLALLDSWRRPALALIALGLVALFFTGSRAAWGGCLIGTTAFLILRSGGKTFWKWAALAAAGAVLGLLIWHGKESSSVSDRWRWWTAAAKMSAERPAFGSGPGGFERLSSAEEGRGLRSLYAHDYYLQTAAELGIPAALAFVAFLVISVRRGKNAALSAGAVAVAFQNLFDYSLHLAGVLAAFWILLAWSDPGPEASGLRLPRFTSLMIAVFLSVEGAFAAWRFGARPLMAIQSSIDAQEAFDRQDVAAAEKHLREAARRDPLHAKYLSDLATVLAMDYQLRPENRLLIEEALASQSEALRREPDNASFRAQLEGLRTLAANAHGS